MMRGVVLASLLAAARGAASWNESYVDGLLHAGAVAKVEGLLPASSFRLDALVAALGDAAWAEPLVHLSSERGAQAALGSYADVAAAVAAGDASAVLRLEKLEAPGAAVAAALGGDGLEWALDRGDSVHVYWSGPGGAALKNHTDPSEILVVQLSGTKEWLVCAEPPRSPFEEAEAKLDRCASYDDVEMAGRACETLTLGPGDALAIPPRTVHSARALGGESVHLTLQRAGARPACGDFDEETGYGAALRAAGARDALVAMADGGVLPPDVALEDADAAARSDGLAEFAIGDDDVADAWRRAARAQGWAGLDALAAPATLTVGAGGALEAAVVSLATRRAPAGGCAGFRAVFGAFAAFDDEAACAAAAAFAAALDGAGAVSVAADRDGSPRVAVERDALADVAVDGASRGAAADDFFAAVAAAAPAASGPLAKLRVCAARAATALSATFAVDDGSVEVGLAAPRGALPQVLDCVAESGVVDVSRDGATGLRVTLAASGAVRGAATVTFAAGGDVALARRRALQTTTWRVGNACAVGTYGSGYECASCNEECDVQHWSGAYYEYSCDSGCTSCASCPECEPGTYQPYTAQTYCYSCPTGTYAPSNGLTSCTVCEVGKYAMAAGSCACTLCEPGTYAPATETVLCTECEAGRYQSAFGATTCYDCPEGFFCPTQADGATACPAGKYSGANAEECISCPDGYYSDADCDGDDADACSGGITSCEPCAAGTYPSTSNAYCISCDAGTYSPGGQETCTECPAGAYCGTGSSSYTICEAGKYAISGSSSCSSCAAGRFLADDGATLEAHDTGNDCVVCDAGRYSASSASGSCAACAEGTFLWDETLLDELLHDNANDCSSCPEGTYSGAGASSCAACDAGTFAAGEGNSACEVCAAGSYVVEAQQGACLPCAAGKYNDDAGTDASNHDESADCLSCDAGKFSEDAGSTACDDCAAGTFASGVGNSDCNVCYAGTYSLGAAATCAHCPAQTSLADEGTAASAHDSEDDCLGCGEGLWCASGGCHECTDCELCTNENHEPTFAVGDATLDLGSVDENGGFAIIGELGASDIENDYLDYVITAGDDAGLFSAANNILYVVADAGLDFETATSYTLTIEATEAYTTEQYSATVTVLVTVNDVNDIAMTAASPSTLSVIGGEAVVITGANLGPYGDAAGVDVTMTYGNGADGATYYAYGCSVTTPGTEITCSTDEGVGALHSWTVTIAAPGATTWTATGAFTTSYAAPTLASVTTTADLATAGGEAVALGGSEFGPRCDSYCGEGEKPCGGACVETSATCASAPADDALCGAWLADTVRVFYAADADDLGSSWACASVDVSSSDGGELTCVTGAGYGTAGYWVVLVGAPGANAAYTYRTEDLHDATVSYAAPSISGIATADGTAITMLPTIGGTTMVVAGANFGAADDLASVSVDMHANQGDGDGWVDLEDCAITVDHTEITCVLPERGGVDYHWRATRAGLTSDASTVLTKYAPPTVTGVSGALTISSTAGGATIYVHGDNFGLTWMESSFTYGPLPDADLYSGTCSVTVKHERAACTTGPGTGSGHALKFTLWGQESVVFDAGVGYGTPYITFYENFYSSDPDRDGFLTAGGEKIVVHGGNFGADDSKIDAVTFGPSGYEYQTCDVDGAYGAPGCGCVVALDHEALECNTTAAVGMNHQWKVIIDGQHSTTPSTKTQPPSVDAIVIVGNASVAAVAAVGGGEVVLILGANFGAEQDKVEGVSYGPSGAEYAARNCTLLGDGALECLTSPGIGEELSFTVVVADQASEPGGVLSYAAPEIFAIAPAAAETAGGALLVINGTNLGLDYYMSYLEVLVDGAVVALDGAELTRATPGSSGYTYACGDGLECVALVAPPMGDAVHTRAVSVRVGSTEHPSIVLSSGEVSYEYDGPVITSLSTADGDTFGTVKCEILGHNFGASANLGSVYVNGAKIPAAQISEYGHNRIVLLYLGGVTGVLYVELGAKASNEMSFEIRSPRLVTEDSRFKPDADGYRTTGTTADGDQRFVTVAGYHFSGSMEVWVGAEEVLDGNGDQRFGVQAEIVGDLEEVDDVLTTLDIDDTCRSLTFKVPESAGAREIITVFSGGYPSYVGNTSADALYISYLPPSIDSVSATLVGTAGGDELALAGDNFGPAEDAVSLGGVACAVVSWSHTTVVVTAPPGEGAGLSLVVEAADQAASVGVGYNPPVVASVDPPSLSLSNAGGLITITGSDFGLDPVVSLPLDADRAVATSVVSHDHSTIVLSVGAGQGRNDLTIDVAGQVAIEPYAYAAPVVASSSPDEAATEGGVAMTIAGSHLGVGSDYVVSFQIDGATLFSTADGSLVVSSYATDAIELLSPEGEASGPMTVVVAACGSVDDPDSCVASGEAVTFTFSPPKIYYVAVEAFDGSLLRPFAGCYVPEGETEEVCVDASCDRTAACKGATLDGCDLRTRGGAEVVLYGANFGLSLPTIVFDGAPVDAELVSHDAGHSTHALVKFVLPAGSGRDLDVVVEAGGTASAAVAFAYDPPCVTSVYPNAPDASGSVLNINGHNFGETDDAAGNVSVVIGGLECGPVVVGATTLPAWQTDGGNAYLYCATPRLTVGVKDVNITAAGQSVYYAESEAMISFSCANDHYGQVADQVYVEADGSCHEECVEDDARACAVVHLPDGNVKNCTVLTREDEYCLECPLGSMCDAWTTVYPIEPYAESGYYRLDLGDAEEYDVSCDAFREHRPFYCYDFSPCSPADACVGANECAEGYTQTKCSKCCDVSRSRNADGSKNPECWNDAKTEEMLYYRAYGECVECPTSQAWLIALLVVGAAGAGGLAYLLKKRRVEIAVLAIGVDYLQVLSVFAGTEIAWPRVLRDFYRNLAVINLDFLDIFPPECSLAMSYEQSWLAVEFAPLILAAACYLVFLVVYTYQVCANAHNRREMKKKLARLRGQLTSALLYGFYFVYLYIAENTLDVLNCARVENPDGARTEEEYLMSDPSELCWTEGETQARLYPVAIGFIFVYIFGYPLLLFWLLRSKETRSLIYDDQLLRYMHKGGHEEGLSPYLATVAKTRAKLGLLYYRFKPDMPYWIVVVVLRKMCLAITTIMFHSSASFQLATLLLILFSSLVLQMRHLPYSSPALGTDVLRLEDERLKRLEEEERASPNYKDQAARKARTKIINFDGVHHAPKVTNVSAKFVFEYNTVEGLLLSCSVLICLFGVMLDSDYLEDGKHKSVREAITILTLFIISVSLAYFGAVIWHEIVSELFPFLKCTPCLENRVQVKERASTFDKNIELAEGNFNRRAARPEKVQDADLMSVEEQLQMKALLAKMQDENRALKKDLAAASKDDAKTATKVVKKKKGFANVFSSSSKTVAHRGSAAMDGASGFSKDASEQIATPTAASNPMMFKKPSATTPKPPKPAPASPKPPPAPTP